MAPRLVFSVQTYVRRGRDLAPAARYEFLSGVEAEEAGRDLSRVTDGVLVYAQFGDPDIGVWEEPEVFARHGDAPRLEF